MRAKPRLVRPGVLLAKHPISHIDRVVTNVAGSGIACSHGSAESTFAFIASEPLSPNLPARPVSRSSLTFADFSDNRGDNGCEISRMAKLEVHASTDEAHLDH